MPRLMIVDDEETIRHGLASMIGRMMPEWEVVLSCEDAQAALAAIDRAAPDLAIIDINMPGMDGLSLADELERTKPELHKIILTGYEKFHYLQQAMRSGVSDYLLKPVQRDELVRAVRKVEASMQERELHSAVHLEKLLLEWFVSRSPDRFRELRRAFASRSAGDGESEYGVLVFFWECENTGIDRLHIDLVAGCLQQFAPGVRDAIGVVVAESCTLFVVSGTQLPPAGEWGVLLHKLGLDQRHGMRGASRLGAFGCSSPFRELEQLNHAYHQAVNSVYQHGENGIRQWLEPEFDWTKPLTEAIETNDADKAMELLRGWKQYIRRASGNPQLVTVYCIQFLAYLSGPVLAGIQTRLGAELREQGASFAQGLPVALSPPVMLRSIEMFVDGLKLEEPESRNYRKAIVRVQQAIKEAYADPELNLEKLAQQVFLHPTYLSELFKETTGQKFIDYLTAVRMEEAKRLLRETDMKMYEVATAVGYTSAKYFSTLFRKTYGMTPVSYREKAH